MNRKQRHFTLIELLTVIAIIVILTGFLLPAVTKVKDKAKETRARTEMKALEMAISQYSATYGYLPCAAHTADRDITLTAYDSQANSLIHILSGGDVSNPGNKRRIQFLENTTGTQPAVEFNDPWGQNYRVVLDADYDGQVNALSTTINRSAAIWTTTPDGKNITSWGD